MKTKNLRKWSLGAAVVVLPFLGCSQKTVTYQPVPAVVTINEVPAPAPAPVAIAPVPVTNASQPDVAEQSLENAPAQVVSPAQTPSNTISPTAAEIVKLAQSGVDEGVMLTYVTNSARVFNLTSDDIVYLNDVGVSGNVVTAMLQRDQALKAAGAAALTSAPPAYTNPIVTAPGAPTPYTTAPQATDVQPEPTTVVQAPEPVDAPNVSYTYFYDSLAPYGSWVDVEGYGRCWRPTVVVANPGWQPYCDSGHWVYSDCGWYWVSDYSWGWAPFHYGRWFRHSRMGWCWAPDTVWGPSWVSWRYTDDYCGWAPLPPAACYSPGIGFTYYGRSVGVNFSFGLTFRHYAFVPVRNFYDRHPGRYRLPEHNVSQFYDHTTVVHAYDHGDRGRIINRGIPVEHVRTVTHASIRPVTIRDADRPSNAHIERGDPQHGRTMDVFRPTLPQPQGPTRLVGEGVKSATRENSIGRGSGTIRPAPSIRAPQSEPDRSTVRNTPGATRESIRNPRDQDNREGTRQNNNPPGVRNIPSVANPPSAPVANPQPGGTRDNRDTRTTPAAPNREPVIIQSPGRTGSISNPRESDGGFRTTTPPAHNTPALTPRELTQPQSSTPAAPAQNPPIRVFPTTPTRQFTPTPSAPAVTPAPPANSQPQAPQPQPPRIIRQDTPSIRAPQNVAPQPSAPVRQESPRVSAPTVERQQPRIQAPAPRVETPAPRIETRSAPPQQSIQRSPAPAPVPRQPAASSGSVGRQDQGSRSDNMDKNNRPGR